MTLLTRSGLVAHTRSRMLPSLVGWRGGGDCALSHVVFQDSIYHSMVDVKTVVRVRLWFQFFPIHTWYIEVSC